MFALLSLYSAAGASALIFCGLNMATIQTHTHARTRTHTAIGVFLCLFTLCFQFPRSVPGTAATTQWAFSQAAVTLELIMRVRGPNAATFLSSQERPNPILWWTMHARVCMSVARPLNGSLQNDGTFESLSPLVWRSIRTVCGSSCCSILQ